MGESLTLTPSRAKWAMFLVLCVAATFFGVRMISSGESEGWLVALLSGISIPICAIQLLPGCAYLRLDSGGFTKCTWFRRITIRWQDVEEFGTWTVPKANNKMVCFNLKPDVSPDIKERLSAVASGYHDGLPDTYGRSAEDLCRLMEEWRSKYSS